MRLYGPSGSRSDFRDRNPTAIHQGALSTQAGGTDVVFATYTVPVGRRALIESTFIGFLITTALAAGQTIAALLDVTTPSPATPVVDLDSGPAAVGPESQWNEGGAVFLTAGQVISCRGVVGIGAGVVAFRGGFHGVEYDT